MPVDVAYSKQLISLPAFVPPQAFFLVSVNTRGCFPDRRLSDRQHAVPPRRLCRLRQPGPAHRSSPGPGRPWARPLRQCQRGLHALLGRTDRAHAPDRQAGERSCAPGRLQRPYRHRRRRRTEQGVGGAWGRLPDGAASLLSEDRWRWPDALLSGDLERGHHPDHGAGRAADDAGHNATGVAGPHGQGDRAGRLREDRGTAHAVEGVDCGKARR